MTTAKSTSRGWFASLQGSTPPRGSPSTSEKAERETGASILTHWEAPALVNKSLGEDKLPKGEHGRPAGLHRTGLAHLIYPGGLIRSDPWTPSHRVETNPAGPLTQTQPDWRDTGPSVNQPVGSAHHWRRKFEAQRASRTNPGTDSPARDTETYPHQLPTRVSGHLSHVSALPSVSARSPMNSHVQAGVCFGANPFSRCHPSSTRRHRGLEEDPLRANRDQIMARSWGPLLTLHTPDGRWTMDIPVETNRVAGPVGGLLGRNFHPPSTGPARHQP